MGRVWNLVNTFVDNTVDLMSPLSPKARIASYNYYCHCSATSLMAGFLCLVVAGIAYWLFGYAFAFGEGNKFIGYERGYFALSDPPDVKYAEFFFQYCFAATAATIVSGAVAERCEFLAFFVYSFFMTGEIFHT